MTSEEIEEWKNELKIQIQELQAIIELSFNGIMHASKDMEHLTLRLVRVEELLKAQGISL